MRSLAMVANFHRERRIGRKTANFIAAVHAHLRSRGIQLNVEFVLDRPDEATHRQIETAAEPLGGARVHLVDFGDLGMARTHGVEAARAEVVCFVDGDDFFSMNWFEGALDHFSSGRRAEVLHTQYMVGFGDEEFVRETVESGHPAFDPLSLAVNWYWSANLAVQTEVFAAAPIKPYDHARGFGSEDWLWACDSLSAGIARVALAGTAYYYRVKPRRFSLGRVGDVIHMASPLFARESLPPPPAEPSSDPIPVRELTAAFFEQAREIEGFEVGLSYLRAVEAGARTVRHFTPHTPPVVGQAVREILASGFGDGSAIVFADRQRLAGGLAAAEAVATVFSGPATTPRLYVVEGEGEGRQARADGYVLSVAELKGAGLFDVQIDRLVARFMIQFRDLTVVNLLSPRARSTALAYSRATRGGVQRWVNVVGEYGFDALSQAYDELDAFAAAGVESENIAIFAKTAREAWWVRGLALRHHPALEADHVSGALGSRRLEPGAWSTPIGPAGQPSPAEARAWRLTPGEAGGVHGTEPAIAVTPALRALAEREAECVFVRGRAFLGLDFDEAGAPRPPGLRIPAVTIVEEDGGPTLYVRHALDRFERELQAGRVPADLASAGAIGVDTAALRAVLERFPERFTFSTLIAACARRAVEAGEACVAFFGPASIVSVSAADLEARADG
ncbi:MAG: glycosyltransferase [Caulobacteraceae bacterium]